MSALLRDEEVHVIQKQIGNDRSVQPVPLGSKDGSEEVRADEFVTLLNGVVLLHFDVQAFHLGTAIGFAKGTFDVDAKLADVSAQAFEVLRSNERRLTQ